MKWFHKKQIAKRAANPYASMEDFRRFCAENMSAFYKPSLLLTASKRHGGSHFFRGEFPH
jgi:hypothetical protein